jgi:carbamoyl-phosphate synthase large subunit
MERTLRGKTLDALTPELWTQARVLGFHDAHIAELTGLDEMDLRARRKSFGLVPSVQNGRYLRGRVRSGNALLYSCFERESE